MAQVLAGSEEDLRWRPVSPDKPLQEAPPKKKKKSKVIKELVVQNAALHLKLNSVIEENIHLRAIIEEKKKLKVEIPVSKPKIAKKLLQAKAGKAQAETVINILETKLKETKKPNPKPEPKPTPAPKPKPTVAKKPVVKPKKVVKKVVKKVIKKTTRTGRR